MLYGLKQVAGKPLNKANKQELEEVLAAIMIAVVSKEVILEGRMVIDVGVVVVDG